MNKLECTFKKPRARQRIEFWIDYSMSDDGWFYDIRYVENKTQKLAHAHCIIQKDIPNWKDALTREGWIQVNE